MNTNLVQPPMPTERTFICSGCGKPFALSPDTVRACPCDLPLCSACSLCQYCQAHPTKPEASAQPDRTAVIDV